MSTTRRTLPLLVASSSLLALLGCYYLRSGDSGGETTFEPPRPVDSRDIAVPAGYKVESVAEGFTFPSAVELDDAGNVYVLEGGYSPPRAPSRAATGFAGCGPPDGGPGDCYGEVFTTPRLLRIGADGRSTTVVSGDAGPWTGMS